jgi:hypothetical protein
LVAELFAEIRVQYPNLQLSITAGFLEPVATRREMMPAPKRTTKIKKTAPAKKRTAAAKPAPARKQAAPRTPPARAKPSEAPRTSPVELLRKAITYYYLLSFCPPERIGDFQSAAGAIRKSLAASAGMQEADFFSAVIPEVSRRIVAFHQDTREPDKAMVAALVKAAQAAEKDAANLAGFQTQMALIASLPGRVKLENRLHRNKGCGLCAAPCRYGYFTLISEPRFIRMQEIAAAEAAKPASTQSPLGMAYRFTASHLAQTLGQQADWVGFAHLANLSFCLLLLGMAKSRLAMPEPQLRLFQTANQIVVQRSQPK